MIPDHTRLSSKQSNVLDLHNFQVYHWSTINNWSSDEELQSRLCTVDRLTQDAVIPAMNRSIYQEISVT